MSGRLACTGLVSVSVTIPRVAVVAIVSVAIRPDRDGGNRQGYIHAREYLHRNNCTSGKDAAGKYQEH